MQSDVVLSLKKLGTKDVPVQLFGNILLVYFSEPMAFFQLREQNLERLVSKTI